MLTVRLNASTIAVRQRVGGGQSSFLIPEGAEVLVKDTGALSGRSKDPTEMVSVEWEGMEVSVFLVDVLERGEHLENDGC